MKNNTFKIISGKLKGRKFIFPDTIGLRPTSGKIRETLFNWLQFDIANMSILDPFAGSGALGLEAISRGAKKNETLFDLIFLDPPFGNDFLPQILKNLSKNNFLTKCTKLYIESEYKMTNEFLNQYIKYKFLIIKQKKTGNVHYCLISFDTL